MNTLTDRAIYGSTYMALAALDVARAFGRALSVAVVIVTVIVVSWLTLAGVALVLWRFWPLVAFGAVCGVVGWRIGHRERVKLSDLLHYIGDGLTAFKRANWLLRRTNEELRDELVRVTGEHQVLAPGEISSFEEAEA